MKLADVPSYLEGKEFGINCFFKIKISFDFKNPTNRFVKVRVLPLQQLIFTDAKVHQILILIM